MTKASLLDEPGRVEEPRAVQEYAEVLSKVAAAGRAVIVCRDGKELAAVIPLEHLELVREILARREGRQRHRQAALAPVHDPAWKIARSIAFQEDLGREPPHALLVAHVAAPRSADHEETLRPPQAWFDDKDNPFEPEEPVP